MPSLSSRFRVTCWELPGHGESAPTKHGFDVAEIADAVAHAVARTGEQRFHYAGVSLGGAVGLQLAIRHSDRLSRISILASGARLGTPEGWRDRASAVRAHGTSSLRAQSSARWFAPSFLDENLTIADLLLDALDSVDDESYAMCCDALASHDVRGLLEAVTVPVLVVWGEHDVVAPVEVVTEMASELPDVTVVRISDAAHLLPFEQPEATVAELVAFHTRATASG